MKACVLDTSALMRLYLPDGPIPIGTEEAIRQAWRAETVVLCPELALVEATQVLHKKVIAGRLSREEASVILSALLELPLEIVAHRRLLVSALELAYRSGLTVYDAVFLALAVDHEATLLTADAKLAAAWSQLSERSGHAAG